MNQNQLNSRKWEIGTLIKLVADMDVDAVYTVVKKLLMHYNPEDIEKLDNSIIYECYCKASGDLL